MFLLKLVQFGGIIQDLLKKRREIVSGLSDEEEDEACKSLTPGKSHPSTARWSKSSSEA